MITEHTLTTNLKTADSVEARKQATAELILIEAKRNRLEIGKVTCVPIDIVQRSAIEQSQAD
jgi:outer membrane cobalamin receptor